MATISIEVLCPGEYAILLERPFPGVGLATSFPPFSDRDPPMWERHMFSVGGSLIHIFDPNLVGKPRRWAYDILDIHNWERFRFSENIRASIKQLFEYLLKTSDDQSIWLYSDAQNSNDPKIYKRKYTLNSFMAYHDNYGIRLNSAIHIIK